MVNETFMVLGVLILFLGAGRFSGDWWVGLFTAQGGIFVLCVGGVLAGWPQKTELRQLEPKDYD